MKLVPSRRFRAELRREFFRIDQVNPVGARKLRDKVLQSVDRLKQFPESGRGWRVPGCREVVVSGLPYVVIYRIHGEDIEILTLFHTSRENPDVH